MYAEKNFFPKGKVWLQGHSSVSSAAGLALIFFIYVLFLRGCKIDYCVAKNSHEQFMIIYFNILAFVICSANFNISLFEQ